eukprot:m51a1_g262 hypothetical protein (204) ;mRNA; f:229913-231558
MLAIVADPSLFSADEGIKGEEEEPEQPVEDESTEDGEHEEPAQDEDTEDEGSEEEEEEEPMQPVQDQSTENREQQEPMQNEGANEPVQSTGNLCEDRVVLVPVLARLGQHIGQGDTEMGYELPKAREAPREAAGAQRQVHREHHIRIRGLDNNDSTFYRQWFEDIARKQSDKKEKKRVASRAYWRRLQAVIERESQEIDADVL